MKDHIILKGPDDSIVTNSDGEYMRCTKTEALVKSIRWNPKYGLDFRPAKAENHIDVAEEKSENTMNNSYDFINTGENDEESDDQIDDQWNWNFGDHSTASTEDRSAISQAIGDTMDSLDEEIDEEMVSVLEDARSLTEDTRINQFECSHEDCGLGHSHADWKHDIRSPPTTSGGRSNVPGFNIADSFAERMEFVPYCHCGANEAAMLVSFFPYISEQMFKDQAQFDGVLELHPDKLRDLIRNVVAGEVTPKEAALQTAESKNSAMYEQVQLFLERVEQMQKQASGAPIGEETRSVIETNREELEEMVSE